MLRYIVHTFIIKLISISDLIISLGESQSGCTCQCNLKSAIIEFQICVICKEIHGSCTQCCKCSTYFHAMCASRAGYRMEVSIR